MDKFLMTGLVPTGLISTKASAVIFYLKCPKATGDLFSSRNMADAPGKFHMESKDSVIQKHSKGT